MDGGVPTLSMKARELAAALARAEDARLMSLEARMASVEASIHSLLQRVTQLTRQLEQLGAEADGDQDCIQLSL